MLYRLLECVDNVSRSVPPQVPQNAATEEMIFWMKSKITRALAILLLLQSKDRKYYLEKELAYVTRLCNADSVLSVNFQPRPFLALLHILVRLDYLTHKSSQFSSDCFG